MSEEKKMSRLEVFLLSVIGALIGVPVALMLLFQLVFYWGV